MNASTLTPAQLIALTLAPVGQSITRTYLRLRLRHSVMSVEVLERQLRNDRAALTIARTTANPHGTERALTQQIKDACADIASEHLLQASINSRLALMAMGRGITH